MSLLRDIVYKYGLLALFVVLVVFFALTRPAFSTTANVLIILQAVAVNAIVALGVTVSMVAGGFDLAAGSIVSFSVMVTGATIIYLGLGGVAGVLLGLASGLLVGLISGVLIVYAKVPDMLATLGSMFVFQGLALIITAGKSISTSTGYGDAPPRGTFSSAFLWIGRGKVAGIPFSVILMLVIAVVTVVFLGRTRTGRILQAVGGNPEAARLAGVRVGRYRILAYAISGFLASVGGVVLVSRLGRGDVGIGGSYLLESVAAALIGFAVLGANRPNAFGTVIGALFIGVVVNGLTMYNVPYYMQDFIKGTLLVIALVISFSSIFNRNTGTSGQ
jgi:monosaccharide ABC transporter membrane protein, CUT2 family (TC 3.A.1.2.-)